MAKTLLGYGNDVINTHMINGLMEGVKTELRTLLREKAEAEIETVVDVVVKRMEAYIKDNHVDFASMDRLIRLEVLFKREEKKDETGKR